MMRRFYESKLVQAIFAFAVAVSLWAYVISNSNPTYTTNVNITQIDYIGLENISAGGLYLIGDLPASIDVRVSGTRNLVTGNLTDYSASFDFSGINQPGDYIIRTKVSTPAGVTVRRIRPEEITVRIDSGVTRDFKPELNIKGKKADEYDISILTDSISASGPESLISAISRFEVRVDADEISTAGERTYTAVAVDEGGKPIYDERLTFDEKVKLNISYTKIVSVDVDTNSLPEQITENYEVAVKSKTESVKIKGDKSLLDGIESVKADFYNADFKPEEENQKLELNISLPSGVSLAEGEKIYAELNYEKKALSDYDIETEGGVEQSNDEN
ncbi:MAG: hypothetical protein E7389_05485 [Ruminococcaceae bacterium]|nr:hypothetical protein [Oscillospiraceae bacterium]